MELNGGHEIEQNLLTEKPEVKSHHHQKKRNEDSSTFEDSLVGEPQAKSPSEKWIAESTTSDSMSHEEIKQSVLPMEKPEVKKKRKRKEDSSTSKDSLAVEPHAKFPVEKLKAVCHESDVDEATDSKMVDTCRKVKPFIPIYPKRIIPDVLPKGPVVFLSCLSHQVKYSDVENFFKGCGEILNIRFFLNENQMFEGRGYVEFETPEAAEEAFKLHKQLLIGEPVTLHLDNPWGPQFEFAVE